MRSAEPSADSARTDDTAVDIAADVACLFDVDAVPWDLHDAFRRLDGACSHAIGFALVCHALRAALRSDDESVWAIGRALHLGLRHVLAAIACSRAGVPFP